MADDKAKVTIYVTPEFKARLDRIAEAERRTGNKQIVLMLEDAAERWEHGTSARPSDSFLTTDGDKVRLWEPGENIPAHAAVVKAKRPRSTVCPHRLSPDQFCRVCDG